GQPAKRRLVGPVHVVDGDQERPGVGERGGQPVETVPDRERRVGRRSLTERPREPRPLGPARAGEQRVALVPPGAREAPLEQLTDDPEREPRLELRAARAQDLPSAGGPPPPRRVEQRLLPDARPALDHEHPTPPQQLLRRGQLALALGSSSTSALYGRDG